MTEQTMDWGLDEKPMDEVTLQEFDSLCRSLFEARSKAEELEKVASDQWKVVGKIEGRILSYLNHFQKDKYPVAGFGTIGITKRSSVKIPRSQEDKQALFNYLHDKGIFYDLVSVNSQTLNSFYKAEREAAELEGNHDFTLPGVGAPSIQEVISVRKGK